MTAVAVFVGPSLERDAVLAAVPGARVEPPAARGDIERLKGEGVSTFLLIDGAFAHRLAVSPREIIDALGDGCRVLGAASMGAIRAAECRPAGMQGVGAIQLLYRWRVLSSDDEVAVVTHPDRGYKAASVALINVRFAVLAAMRRGWLGRGGAMAVLASAKRLYFSDRQWPAIFAGAGLKPDRRLRELCEGTDWKRRDAALAVARLAALPPLTGPPTALPARARARYRGHDPLLGHTRVQLEPILWRWMRESGRLDRYGLPATASASEAWDALEAEHEVERELMRWYARERVR